MRGGGDCTQATKIVVENCQCYGKKTNQQQFTDHYTFLRKLPTYPSPKPKFCPKGEVSVNVGLGEG